MPSTSTVYLGSHLFQYNFKTLKLHENFPYLVVKSLHLYRDSGQDLDLYIPRIPTIVHSAYHEIGIQ